MKCFFCGKESEIYHYPSGYSLCYVCDGKFKIVEKAKKDRQLRINE